MPYPVYPWAHYETGSPYKHFARCTTCGEDIAFWHQPKDGQAVPATARKKIRAHLATHVLPSDP